MFSALFDPAYLHKNEQRVRQTDYGREQLAFLSKRFNGLVGFDPYKVATEWESLRPSLISYIASDGKKCSRKLFWKEFTLLRQSISINFTDDYKNILLLVDVYLVSPTNLAECERGFSASDCIQTNGRSWVMIDTLNSLLTVRLLLLDDIPSKRCNQIVAKSLDLWNNPDENRRWKRKNLIIDVPGDYEPTKQTRPSNIRKKTSQTIENP